jgi:hypothetical protein
MNDGTLYRTRAEADAVALTTKPTKKFFKIDWAQNTVESVDWTPWGQWTHCKVPIAFDEDVETLAESDQDLRMKVKAALNWWSSDTQILKIENGWFYYKLYVSLGD